MFCIHQSSIFFPKERLHHSYTFPISISAFLSRRRRKCLRRDTAIRVLQTKGFQVTETSRSSCHLNELRTALKMEERCGEDRGKGERLIGGRTKGRITRHRSDETAWIRVEDGKGCEKEERRLAIRPTEARRIERQYSQQQTRQIAR